MTERAGRMLGETGDDDAAEFGVMESQRMVRAVGSGWGARCRRCSVVTFTGEPRETMEHAMQKLLSCS
jgi:hypothetical protein